MLSYKNALFAPLVLVTVLTKAMQTTQALSVRSYGKADYERVMSLLDSNRDKVLDNLTPRKTIKMTISNSGIKEWQVVRTVEFNTQVCVVGETIVGFVHYINSEPSFLCLEFDKICCIKAFVIEAKYRRKGYGSILLKEMLSEMQKKEIDHMWVRIDQKNKAALKFFERSGFKKNAENGQFNDYSLAIDCNDE